jgi:transcriptional antiterminator RfaH
MVAVMASPWAVVNTQPHHERTALDHLARQEFNAYCPMARRRVKHVRRVQDVLRPLFPGYLFVRLSRKRRAGGRSSQPLAYECSSASASN